MTVRWSRIAVGVLTIAAPAVAQTLPAPATPETSPAVEQRAAGAPASSARPPRRETAGKGARPSPYTATVAKGHAAMAAGNFAAATDAYRAAVVEAPKDALAWYFLGEAQAAAGELARADGSFAGGIPLAANDELHARLLFVTADLRERQGNWAEARRAWAAYGEFLTAHPAVPGYAATATERASAIGRHVELEEKSAAVKQRSDARAKETAAPSAPGAAGATNPSNATKK